MSAIFGIVNLDGNNIIDDFEKKMIEGFKAYKLDSVKSLYSNNIFMGCGLQYITPESLIEVLPYDDETRKLIITADAIIDNRKELLEVFEIKEELQNTVTDSELILQAYVKWGQECPKYLVGDFAFAIWDKNKEELFCARDHVGKRTLYFYHDENIFAFSTLMKPLFKVIDKVELNERWITEYLILPLAIHQLDCNETIYTAIKQLPPAHSLIIKNGEITKVRYWNPLEDVKPLKLSTDKEYEEEFRKVFYEAVTCRLRCNGNVGIMLSGGMDSGAVASIAATLLQKERKDLMAYSSIPIKNFNRKLSQELIPDESEYIKSISDKYENIKIKYMTNDGQNSVKRMDHFIRILEQPYKVVENLFWYNSIIENASNDGCKVLLNGQGGNMTVSYGYFFSYLLSLYRSGKFVRVIKEVNQYCRKNKIPRKKFYKYSIIQAIPYRVKKKFYKNNEIKIDSCAKNELIDKWAVKDRLIKSGYLKYPKQIPDTKEMRKYIVNLEAFSQIALMETKLSLANGIVQRDPTSDKRMIEFCLSLPDDQYVRNGNERYLIQRAMVGILPDKIRLNTSKKGLQSADWIQRLQPDCNEIFSDLQGLLTDNHLSDYIDIQKLSKDLEEVKECFNEEKELSIRTLIVALILSKFLNSYRGELIDSVK